MCILYVGGDVAKDSSVAGVYVNGKHHPLKMVKNDEAGFKDLSQHVHTAKAEHNAEVVRLIVEPTGGYELRVAYLAHQHGWQVCLVNAKQSLPRAGRGVRDWAKGQGQRAKTDALDARRLAQFAAERAERAERAGSDHKPLPLWQPLPEGLTQLDGLLARRRDLEQMLLQERNRQGMYASRPGIAQAVPESVNALITALTGSLHEIERAIQDLINQHPDMREQINQLDSVPGVGAKTVLPLFMLLARWHVMTGGRGSDKALTAFVGLDPDTHQSGTKNRRGGISKTGDPELRRLLYMAALGGKRGNDPLRHFFERLVARGKLKMVALIAAARKVLLWSWAVFRSHAFFDPAKLSKTA